MIDLGDVHRLAWTHKDPDGGLANPGNVALTITLPDGTTTVVDPVAATSTGVFRHDYLTVQAGRHVASWLGTGANPGAYTETFDVRGATGALISVADAKEQLNITSEVSDEELRGWLESATSICEVYRGPLLKRERVEVLRGGRHTLKLASYPVLEIASVVPLLDGLADVAVADLRPDEHTGLVWYRDGRCFPHGRYRWTYEAGRTVVSAATLDAVKIIVKHMWQTQRGAYPTRRVTDDDLVVVPGLGYLIPNRARSLLEAEAQPGGFA
ncbi:MAG: hypothetical protein ACRDYU_07435 [Actinomycetes bacterium]